MSMNQPPRQNGEKSSPIEIFHRFLDPSESDSFLQKTNLRTGNYTEEMYWQQMSEYQSHMYGESAFGNGKNLARAESDAKYELAKADWESMTEEEREEALEEYDGSKRSWFEARGEQKWNEIGVDETDTDALVQQFGEQARSPEFQEYYRELARLDELAEYSRVDDEFMAAFGRMIVARHEASGSRGAHHIDAITGRVKELKGMDRKEAKKRIGNQE